MRSSKTVGQLINELHRYPLETQVIIETPSGCEYSGNHEVYQDVETGMVYIAASTWVEDEWRRSQAIPALPGKGE